MVLLKNIKGCPTKTNGKSWPLPEILGIFCYLKMTNWILNIIVLPHYTELKISTCPRCFSVHYLETKLFSLFYSTHCMNINSHILFNFEYFLVVRFSWLWYNIYTIYYRAWPNIFCRWYVPGFPLTKHGGWDGWRWGRPELVHTENSFNLTFS